MNPYHSQFGMSSASDEMQHVPRSVSQPNSRNWFPRSYDRDDPQPGQLPRSPTYPPTGRRRMHSDTGVQDGAFADEMEFRLFVEATAGLGPEQAFRNSTHQPSPVSIRRPHSWDDDHYSSRASPSEELVSPLEETPTTLRALQHLAQMPRASHEPQRQATLTALQQLAQMPQASSDQPRQRMQASASGLDLWLTSADDSASPEHDYVDSGDEEHLPDEEPPDYASSQAQAEASQRAEAARRAQELQWRWQSRSGGRGP
ncbi:hypothetical protein LTR08_003516 [Meristemomyces frigidus]|nr:hypothetical protein LTR08_003516 [Meristemomyces frigidus]